MLIFGMIIIEILIGLSIAAQFLYHKRYGHTLTNCTIGMWKVIYKKQYKQILVTFGIIPFFSTYEMQEGRHSTFNNTNRFISLFIPFLVLYLLYSVVTIASISIDYWLFVSKSFLFGSNNDTNTTTYSNYFLGRLVVQPYWYFINAVVSIALFFVFYANLIRGLFEWLFDEIERRFDYVMAFWPRYLISTAVLLYLINTNSQIWLIFSYETALFTPILDMLVGHLILVFIGAFIIEILSRKTTN
jgi:hypothetical protein